MRQSLVSFATLIAACSLLAETSSADYTIDLIWADTGTPTLTVDTGAPNASPAGTPCGDGQLSAAGPGRCLTVQLRADADWTGAATTLGWNAASSGLAVDYVATRSVGPFNHPTGGGPFLPSPALPTDCVVLGCDSAVGSFGVVLAVGSVAPGTYLLGSIHFDVSGAPLGTHDIFNFQRVGVDGVIRSDGTLAPVQVNGALLNVIVPEPATALLLGAGVLALACAGRRRERP